MNFKQNLFAASFLLATQTSLMAQNGTKLLGYDAKTIGRGGVVTGTFDHNSLLQTNPAGISFSKSSEFNLGIGILLPKTYFKNEVNDKKGKSNTYPLGTISYVKKPTGKFSYGFGIFTEGGLGADFTLNHKLFVDQNGNYVPQEYHSKFAVLQGGATGAYKISDKFSIGATAQLVYSQLEFGAPLSLPPTLLRGALPGGGTFGDLFGGTPPNGLGYSELTGAAKIQGLTAWGFSGKIGIAYRPNETFSFGINYTTPTSLSYKGGSADLDLTYQFNDAFGRVVAGIIQQNPGTTPQEAQQQAAEQFTQLGVDLPKGVVDKYKAEAKFKTPQSIATGFSFRANKKLKIGVDGEWVNWKNAFSTLDISLTNGTNPNISKLLGTNGSISFPFPLQWKNSFILRTGVEYTIDKSVSVRAGYIYGSNPVPASTLFPIFPAIVKSHITLGGSVHVSKSVAINLAFEHALNTKEKAAANSFIGSQYNNSTSGLSTTAIHASVSWLLK